MKIIYGILLLLSVCHSCLASTGIPLPASTRQQVEVPASLAYDPFDVPRLLTIPPHFRIAVLARVNGARFMAVARNGDIFVSQPWSGKISLIRTNTAGLTLIYTYAQDLRQPHDMVFHTIDKTKYLYISESNKISRYKYNDGDLAAPAQETIVANLPDDSLPELKGRYGHALKNIALDSKHNLYVSIASSSNDDPYDTKSDPIHCAIYKYTAMGKNRQLFAQGIRNSEGLSFVPGTDELWITVANRDNIGYPRHRDFDGDGQDDYSREISSYIDNHPPEEFIHVRAGANYGWPYANPNPDKVTGKNAMPFDPDVNNNPGWKYYPKSAFTPVDKGITAHSTPLGLKFLQNAYGVPENYRNGVVIALHGSWNRSKPSGYKVIYFPWDPVTNRPGEQMTLISGWLNADKSAWGRPVDIATDRQGNLLISDDESGTIYKMTYIP